MEKLSATIIVKNEADNLKKLLPELHWCDEVVIVDDFSTDETMEVCRQFNCKIFQRKLDHFGLQKQFAVAQATYDWVFSIDADELLSDELVSQMKEVLKNPNNDLGGYSMIRRHEFMGRVFRHSAESRTAYLRLFNRSRANFNSAKVHEIVETSFDVKLLEGYLIHHSFRDLGHYFEKSNMYSTLSAQAAFTAGKRKNMAGVLFLSPFLFLKTYLVDRNCAEGLPGLLWALFQNWYRIVKYAKLQELYYVKGKRRTLTAKKSVK